MPTTHQNVFKFPIPIDPFRLLLGIRAKWFWFILFPLVLGVLGTVAGLKLSENRYSVSLQMLKSEVPNTIQTSESGEPFKPRALSDDTLLATTYASEVLEKTGQQLDPPRSGQSIKSQISIEKQRKTAFFYLTAHSRVSREDAIALVNGWANEIVQFTRSLQKKEALDMSSFLNSQYIQIKRQLTEVNNQILEFSRREHFFDENSQSEAYLSSLENLQIRLADAQIELKAKETQIERFRSEIRQQSPVNAKIKIKENELTLLLGRYTQENPLVKEKLYEIEHLKLQQIEDDKNTNDDLKSYTGSDLGNNLYLEILALENERISLQKEIAGYETLIEKKRFQVESLPEKHLMLTELKHRRQQLLMATSLLTSRLKESDFYVKNAPGYWQIFQKPTINEVLVSSQKSKAIALGFAGAIAGTMIAILLAILWECKQTGLRTPLQAAIVTATIPTLIHRINNPNTKSLFFRAKTKDDVANANQQQMRHLWYSHMARPEPPYFAASLITVGEIEEEHSLWKQLFAIAADDNTDILFIDLDSESKESFQSDNQHKNIEYLDISNKSAESICETLEQAQQTKLILVRGPKSPNTHAFTILSKLNGYFLLNSPRLSNSQTTRNQSNLLRNVLGAPTGLMLIEPALTNTVPWLIMTAQNSLFQTLQRKQSSNE